MKRSWLSLLFVVLTLAGGCRVSNGDVIGPRHNLALGKTCLIAPAATYSLTHTADDGRKLTDGRHATGNFWSDRSATVGWQDSGVIRIEIDLEQDCLIEGISISSARGQRSGVSYPERVDLFVSADGAAYRYLGDMLNGHDHGDGWYQIRTFKAEGLKAQGRKALIVIKPHGTYSFIDEIEIRGGIAPAGRLHQAGPVIAREAVAAFLAQRYALSVERRALAVLISEAQLQGAKVRGVQDDLAPLLNSPEPHDGELFGQKLGSIRAALFARRQVVLARQDVAPLVIWHTDPWADFSPLAAPGPGGKIPTGGLDMDLAAGGVFSDGIGIANATGTLQSVAVSIELERNQARVPTVTAREVIPVIRADFHTVGDPLKDLPDGALQVKPGESRQIWLTVRAEGVEPGKYHGKIRLTAPAFRGVIPFTVQVWPVRLPQPPRGAVNAWSYLNWRPIRGIPEQAAADLNDHRVNVIVVHPDQLPWPGSYYQEFDKVISKHPFARQFLFYLAFNDPGRRSMGTREPFMSPRWQQEFRHWIKALAAHLKQSGLPPGSFAFYPVDEPKNEEDAEVLFRTAKLIKEIDPALKVYTTYGDFGRFSDATYARLLTVVDQYQVGIDSIANRKVRQLIGAGKEVWSYSGSGKSCHPFSFYRLQAWRAVKHGATGIGFWAYADSGASGTAWDDFDGTRPDFSVIYEASGGIISSKRWEAWREGAEDYELLSLVRDKARDRQARDETGFIVDRVLSDPGDYRRFLQARRQLLELGSR